MQALTQVHMMNNHLSPRQFFRAAYQYNFGEDISELALTNDVKQYEEQGKVPNYLCQYLIKIYGVQ